MRPTKLKNYMDSAQIASERSHDAETKVGAVLVNNESGAEIARGYNGFVRGADDAILPNTRPDKYEFILHAEENIITNCVRHGISMNNCMVVCTLSPCKHCMRLLVNCGITKVVCRDLYKDFQEILKMPDVKVTLAENKDENGFYHITYEV